MVSSLAKEAENASIAGSHRTCSNRRSGENKYSNDELSAEGRVFLEEPIHYGCRQENEQELLYMWRFWTFSKKL